MPGTFSYRQADGSAYRVVSAADSATGFTAEDGVGEIGSSNDDYSGNRRFGTDVTDFSRSSAGLGGLRFDLGSGTEWDMTTEDFSWWFLYTSKTGDRLANADSVILRVYSDATPGSNYAEWNVTGAVTAGSFYPVLVKSWNPFVISGNSPDTTAGTTPTYTSIRHVSTRYNWTGGNSGNQQPAFATDLWKIGRDIRSTAGTSGSPADFPSMVAYFSTPPQQSGDGDLGIVFQKDVFVEMWAGHQVGDGTTATFFAAENLFIYNNQYSDNVQHDWTVENNAILRLGDKDVGTDDTYAINGCILSVRSSRTADFTVASGGELRAYATKFFRWNTIDLNDTCEIIDCDFDSNDTINLDSADITVKNSKFHDPSGSGYIGSISAAITLDNVKVFNCVRGFRFTTGVTVSNYVATDNTYDLVVDDGVTVTLVNSTFDPDKLLQV